jgi:hypothetical protein
MSKSYAAEFETYRDEFRSFQKTPYITGMGQEWLKGPFLPGGAVACAASSTQLHAPNPTPSLGINSKLLRPDSTIDGQACLGKAVRLLGKSENQVTRATNLERQLVQRSRKGHKKSRQGCYQCKRRKIKV